MVAVPGWNDREEIWWEGRLEADVFTDRFFILRIFLFGESALLRPGRLANAEEDRCD